MIDDQHPTRERLRQLEHGVGIVYDRAELARGRWGPEIDHGPDLGW